MATRKSQKSVSDYLSHIMLREGLGLSDYFDKSIPYNVKPVPSLRPMDEDEITKNESHYWMFPDGQIKIIDNYHGKWANNYLKQTTGVSYPTDQLAEDKLMDMGFVSIKCDGYDMIIIEYSKSKPPADNQWRIVKDIARKNDFYIRDETADQIVKLEENGGANQLFIEHMMPDNIDVFKSHLAHLFSYLKKELQLRTVPKVKLISDEKNASKVLGKTAYYDPDTKTIALYTTDRHQKDILRSFAHEVIHHWQHENEKLQSSKRYENGGPKDDPKYAQNNPWLRQMEKQAYLLGNIIFRDWEDDKKAKDRKSGKKMVEKTMLIGKQYPPRKHNYRGNI